MSFLRLALPVAMIALAPAARAADAMAGNYTLSLEAPARVAAGKSDKLVLRITPKKGYEVHKEPPAKLAVTASGPVSLERSSFTNKDIAVDGAKASFTVPFSAQSAGKATVEAAIHFYICNDSNCSPTDGKASAQVVVQ